MQRPSIIRSAILPSCLFTCLVALCIGCSSPSGQYGNWNSPYGAGAPAGPGSYNLPLLPVPTPQPSPAPASGPNGPIGTLPDYNLTPDAQTARSYGYPTPNLFAGGGQVDGRSMPLLGAKPQPRTRHFKSQLAPGSRAAHVQQQRSYKAGRKPRVVSLVPGIPASPQEDLRYRGGKTIKDLKYINIYVGGDSRWQKAERRTIDDALEGAMLDPYLNHVVMQYFNDQPITAEFLGSFLLENYQPTTITQRDIRDVLRSLYGRGAFKSMPLDSTVMNFMLPSGVILEDPDAATAEYRHRLHPEIPAEDEASSREGLGGYHGSLHIGADTIYYAVCVYSERRSDGFQNGIPAFKEPWKNIVATFYHELQEARTDPDVDDAITTGRESALGWTSESGEEIGDYPLTAAQQLSMVIKEVPLADGSGMVPVQLLYSNAVHGPEGPIERPHRGPVLQQPTRRKPAGGTPSTPQPPKPKEPPPSGPPPETALDWINREWGILPNSVRSQILQLVEDNVPADQQRH